ncbi:MAG: peptidoglycan DD-metalloendopeptidase family protein [Xenococcaceae cyanobacterium]
MTQQYPQGFNPLNAFNRRLLLKQGVGLISGLSVLSSGLLWIQPEAEASTSSLEIPVRAADQAQPPKAAASVTPAPVKIPKPATQTAPAPRPAPRPAVQTTPVQRLAPSPAAQTAPVQRPAPRPASLTAPAPVPTTTKPERIQLSAPRISIPSPPVVEIPSRVLPQAQSTVIQPTAEMPKAGKNSYIDTTNYSRGATGSYTGPTSVVLTERSTGCKTVLRSGQLASGSCGTTALRQPTTATGSLLPPPQLLAASSGTTSRAVRAARSKAYGSRINRGRSASVYQGSAPQYNRATTRPKARSGNGNTALLFPLSIPATITSAFGWRINPITGKSQMHSGTDIGAPLGTPVLAAYSGKVAIAEFLGGYGLTVILRHEKGTQESRYAHLSKIFVQSGEWVEQGTVIGLVGSTGFSTGPHLHFEWRHLTNSGWVAVDAGLHLEYAMENLIRSMQMAAEAISDAEG